LTGVRVIDMTAVLMGPYATQIMGDMGADVIKVESFAGDTTRHLGHARHPGMGPMFMHLNRSKRGLVLDLKRPAGRAALLRLAEGADVLIHSLRARSMARLDLAYPDLAAVNPRLIYCSVYGYGEGGRYAGKPAYDDLIQGAAAIPTLYARAGADAPRYAPMAIADRVVGLHALSCVVMALYERERRGRGQAIEVPMFETMASLVLSDHMYDESFEPPAGGTGYPRLLDPDRRPYPTSDGHICVLCYTDGHWRKFFALAGKPELTDDPRFASIETRTKHVVTLNRFLADALAERQTGEWLALLAEADIPAMALHSVESLRADPHLADVGLLELVDHPTEGRLRAIGVPSNWSETSPEISRQAPRLGGDSTAVLAEAGYSDAEIAALIADGITLDGRD
jgi:crotonobetainyl-CoA:carnitine CoA-transferase CaiB-like acyl-CoA transferase